MSDEPKCICDGAAYYSPDENRSRHPFIVNAGCPIHAPAAAVPEAQDGRAVDWQAAWRAVRHREDDLVAELRTCRLERDSFRDVAERASAAVREGERERPGGYRRLAEGTTWPDPWDANEVEWALRYGDAASVRLVAASYVHAFRALVEMPKRRRDSVIAGLRAPSLAAPEGTEQ